MLGYKSEDTVCLTRNDCATDVAFLGAISTKGLSGLKANGILGLAPSEAGSKADMLLNEL